MMGIRTHKIMGLILKEQYNLVQLLGRHMRTLLNPKLKQMEQQGK